MESSKELITTKGPNAFKKQARRDQITGMLFTLPVFSNHFYLWYFSYRLLNLYEPVQLAGYQGTVLSVIRTTC